MENVIIRKIKEKDISSVVDIQIKGWKVAYKGIIDDNTLNTMNRDERIAKIKKDYKENGVIVAESNNEVVGFCRYVDSNKFTQDMSEIDCELLALYVKPELKYNGIGTKLFRYVIGEFKNKNKTKMILWCLKDNEPSKKFYKKMGGEITRERTVKIEKKNYYEEGFIYNI